MEALISHLPQIPFFSKRGAYQPSPNLVYWPLRLVTRVWILRMDLAGKGLGSADLGVETKIQTDEDNYMTAES